VVAALLAASWAGSGADAGAEEVARKGAWRVARERGSNVRRSRCSRCQCRILSTQSQGHHRHRSHRLPNLASRRRCFRRRISGVAAVAADSLVVMMVAAMVEVAMVGEVAFVADTVGNSQVYVAAAVVAAAVVAVEAALRARRSSAVHNPHSLYQCHSHCTVRLGRRRRNNHPTPKKESQRMCSSRHRIVPAALKAAIVLRQKSEFAARRGASLAP
jgi:hypothetical protein